MADRPVRYTSDVDDNTRWFDFAFREGDIVVSTRSKHGTTWMQMICALLVFQQPTLPAPLHRLSPWLDWRITPTDDVFSLLAAQRHRRIIKSHTPLDGLPADDRATYVVVAREPVDAAVSLYHQGANLNRARINELVGLPPPDEGAQPRPPLRDWLLEWIEHDADPRERLESLPGVIWHVTDAWHRREGTPRVLLVHYDDLVADLEGEMRRLAAALGEAVPEDRWPALVRAAGFSEMSRAPRDLAPDPAGLMHDVNAFFRRGSSGAAAEVLTEAELARYRARVGELAEPDVARWLVRSGPVR